MGFNSNVKCVDQVGPGLGVDDVSSADCPIVSPGIDVDAPGLYASLGAVVADPCTVPVRGGCTDDGHPYLVHSTPGKVTANVLGGLSTVGPFVMTNTAQGAGLVYAPILSVPFSVPCASLIYPTAEWAVIGINMSANTPYPGGPPRVIVEMRLDGGPWTGISSAQYGAGLLVGTAPWQAQQNGLRPFHGASVAAGAHALQMRLRYEKNEPGTATLLAENKGIFINAVQA